MAKPLAHIPGRDERRWHLAMAHGFFYEARQHSQTLKSRYGITAAQLHVVLNDMTIPDPDPKQRGLSPYPALPRRGHLAIYSLNLVLLRAHLGDERYVLEENLLGEWVGACRPWDGPRRWRRPGSGCANCRAGRRSNWRQRWVRASWRARRAAAWWS